MTGAVMCPEEEERLIVSLDTSKVRALCLYLSCLCAGSHPRRPLAQMNKILWIDKDNMMARIQAGVVGSALERKVVLLSFSVDRVTLLTVANRLCPASLLSLAFALATSPTRWNSAPSAAGLPRGWCFHPITVISM